MKKLLFLALLFAFPANAQIPEGAIVKTATSPDVYIVKYNGDAYKRLVLNPKVFESYGHLKWENLLTISQSEMDSFTTSDLVRVDGSTDIYLLAPNGDDGEKYRLTSTQGYDTKSIYTINQTDFDNYVSAGTVGAIKVEAPQITPVDVSQSEANELMKEDIIAELEAKEKAEKEAEEQARIKKANSILSQLNSNPILEEYNTLSKKLEPYFTRIAELQALIKQTAGITAMTATDEIRDLSIKHRSDLDRFNELKPQKEEMEAVISRVEDYRDNNIPLSSADRTFLNSLGISI